MDCDGLLQDAMAASEAVEAHWSEAPVPRSSGEGTDPTVNLPAGWVKAHRDMEAAWRRRIAAFEQCYRLLDRRE